MAEQPRTLFALRRG